MPTGPDGQPFAGDPRRVPVYICWAQINRSALIRIPRYSVGSKKQPGSNYGCPDSSCNTYLATAAVLATGLDGIERRLLAPPPIEKTPTS